MERPLPQLTITWALAQLVAGEFRFNEAECAPDGTLSTLNPNYHKSDRISLCSRRDASVYKDSAAAHDERQGVVCPVASVYLGHSITSSWPMLKTRFKHSNMEWPNKTFYWYWTSA